MQTLTIADYIEPNIKYLFNESGVIIAACVSGLVGDTRPDDNKAVPEI